MSSLKSGCPVRGSSLALLNPESSPPIFLDRAKAPAGCEDPPGAPFGGQGRRGCGVGWHWGADCGSWGSCDVPSAPEPAQWQAVPPAPLSGVVPFPLFSGTPFSEFEKNTEETPAATRGQGWSRARPHSIGALVRGSGLGGLLRPAAPQRLRVAGAARRSRLAEGPRCPRSPGPFGKRRGSRGPTCSDWQQGNPPSSGTGLAWEARGTRPSSRGPSGGCWELPWD